MARTWREFGYQVAGKSHVADGKPGQDRFRYEVRSGVQVLCLADGASSAARSEHGAQAVVEAGCKFLATALQPESSEVSMEVGEHLVPYLVSELEAAADRLDCDVRDLASTFLAVAKNDTEFVAAHIGDGVIGAERDGEMVVLSEPDNGEFANVTTFVTSENAAESLRVISGGIDGLSGFILMTDGTADSLYNFDSQTLARACWTLVRIVADAPTYVVRNPEYKKVLKRIMDFQIRENTDDDCAIGILARSDRR